MTGNRAIRGGLIVVVLAVLSPTLQAAPLRNVSVEQFNKSYKKWIGLEISVSGRLSANGKGLLRFRNCPVTFRFGPNLTKLPQGTKNAQVDGELVREGRRVVVRINSMRAIRSDEEEFNSRKLKIKRDDARGWYDLGDWAINRAAFYEDDQLSKRGSECYEKGISLEHDAINNGDTRALLELADKAEKLGLKVATIEAFRFEAYLVMRDAAKTNEDLERAISEVAANLPGSETPPNVPLPELRKEFRKSPLTVYKASQPGRRRLLHRMLMAELILSRLNRRLGDNYERGFAVADDIDREVPEFAGLATEYREKALAALSDQVKTLSRVEMLDLREKYRSQGLTEKGNEVVASWLHMRRQRLAEDDLEGRISLADSYIQLLNQRARAVELLIEASELGPQDKEVAGRLEKLGYRKQDDEWVSLEEFENTPESKIETAMRTGRVLKGMTPEQVKKSQGAPDKITRSASRHQIREIWHYYQSDVFQLTIHLRRTKGAQQSRVFAIVQSKRH